MPPLVQSSNWIGLARQAGRLLARVSVRPTKKVKPTNISTLPQQAKQIIRHTFPSLFTPAHLLELNPAYLPASNTFARAAQLSRAGNPLVQAARGFRTAARQSRRPTVPAPVNVGLGTARGYASSGAAGASHQIMSAKVPMMMRALASLLDNELELDRTLPYPSKYTPYDIERISRIASAIASSKVSFESVDEIRRTFEEYFTPVPQPITTLAANATASGSASSSNLLVPSQLVTPGVYTTLTIPLAPSYHSILDFPRQEPYAGSDLGVRKFASLLKGILTINQIVHSRASHFIIPLMDKLDSLGITFDPSHTFDRNDLPSTGSTPRCQQWVSFIDIDDYQIPETISIKFHDRSSEDVRRILGESLRSAQEGGWWGLTEYRIDPDLHMDETTEAAIQDEWDDQSSQGRLNGLNELMLDTSQLVMPLIDLDGDLDEPYPYPVYNPPSSAGYGGDWTDIDSDVSTPSTIPEGSPVDSPYSEGSGSRSGSRSAMRSSSFASSLSDHLDAISQLDFAQRPRNGSDMARSLSDMSDLSDPAQHEWQVLSDSD